MGVPGSFRDSQLASELANVLYDFLPGKAHPYGNQTLSFPSAAQAVGVSRFWPGGSKRPALTQLLSMTLQHERGRFCDLVEEIIRRAITYRSNKQPITRQEIHRVNGIIADIGFKIPSLYESSFLNALRTQDVQPDPSTDSTKVDAGTLERLHDDLMSLAAAGDPHGRGRAFEKFLNGLFRVYGLTPREAFSLHGEQIDGSFQLGGDTYLLEAKWHAEPIEQGHLLVFSGKVAGKAQWTRGLLVSYNRFSADGLAAFQTGRQTNIICMDGLDLHHVLSHGLDLHEVICAKTRRAAETNRAFVPVRDLFFNVT